MKNTLQFLVTVRFPSWGYGEKTDTYPAFGKKYLIEIPCDSSDDDDVFTDLFKVKFKEKIGHDFDGEVLFVEEVELNIL